MYKLEQEFFKKFKPKPGSNPNRTRKSRPDLQLCLDEINVYFTFKSMALKLVRVSPAEYGVGWNERWSGMDGIFGMEDAKNAKE